jgi:hypothetical protein
MVSRTDQNIQNAVPPILTMLNIIGSSAMVAYGKYKCTGNKVVSKNTIPFQDPVSGKSDME